MGKIDDDNWEIKNSKVGNLQEAIHSGVGLAGWHGGMSDAFRDNTNYQFLVGSQFVCHPGDFVDYEVNIIDKQHEIVNGINHFKVFSEQYFLHIDPSINIIASTKFNKNITNGLMELKCQLLIQKHGERKNISLFYWSSYERF